MSTELVEIPEGIEGSSLYSEDLAPVSIAKRSWSTWNYSALWISMSLCIPTYMLASSLIEGGMNWWQAIVTIFIGNVVVLLPMILNGHAGAKYGIPFPVFARASFGVQGTTFAVLTDGERHTLMTVNEGTVLAENYKLLAKTKVIEGHTYLVNRDGRNKIILDLDAVNLYDWNIQNLEQKTPSLNDLISQTGDVGPTLDDKERAYQDLLKEIDDKIVGFKNTNKELLREMGTLEENAIQSRNGLKDEKVKVDKDIRCLQTSTYECNLFTEKILIARGFPKLWGNRRYRSGLVVELQKYLNERNEEVTGREDEAKVLAKLMVARNATLKQMEEDRKNENDTDKIIPTLQAERLKR